MPKTIISIGFELASNEVHEGGFNEKISLLDWDVILFRPTITQFVQRSLPYDYYNGKICLDDTQSFRAKEACEHWRRELYGAVDSGKTVIVHLNQPDIVYAATGTKETSGTGRNQKVTRHVAELSSYSSLPIQLEPTITQGSEMMLPPEHRALLSSYWERFGELSKYQVVFPKDTKGCCVVTKHGKKPVGLRRSSQASSGSLLLLPDLDFERDEFFEEIDDEYQFSKSAEKFASTYVSEIVGLEKKLRKSSEKTPEPSWALSAGYVLSGEVSLREKLLLAETRLEKAQKEKEQAVDALAHAGQLRDLLFEKGKPLEAAILKALSILGFKATQFVDENSEFDAVFESADGRLIGEAEGRDNKAIAIGKLRQLSTNIIEDLEREDVLAPAKGILFGNAFRLKNPEERDECFTEKCKTSAVSMTIGLVSTPDLFRIAQFLLSSEDEEFAKNCRTLLLQTSGIVSFPDTPVVSEEAGTEVEQAE
jgi:hypothetical protein